MKRPDRAYSLLTSTDRTIKEIAAGVGFCNPIHFSKLFKTRMGMAPGGYRKQEGTT
ncbi:MAG: helix-turn-helix domain-containing protein [Planctomycetota bacterium]|jgi:transcriptional regulator GlxA family with amidase domain